LATADEGKQVEGRGEVERSSNFSATPQGPKRSRWTDASRSASQAKKPNNQLGHSTRWRAKPRQPFAERRPPEIFRAAFAKRVHHPGTAKPRKGFSFNENGRLEIDNHIFQESSNVIPALIIKALQRFASA
jgi:hypothetical protein